MDYLEQRQQVAAFMVRLYDKGLTTCIGGNVSLKVDDVLLITPSGYDKASLKAEDIIVYSLKDDKNLTPELIPSMETDMHKSVYQARDDVFAVIHSHPVAASCFSASSESINLKLIGESAFILKNIEKVPYKTMGTKDLALSVKEKSTLSDVLLLENHGVLTMGKDLFNAYSKTEVLENAAKTTYVSKIIGNSKELSDKNIEEILNFYI